MHLLGELRGGITAGLGAQLLDARRDGRVARGGGDLGMQAGGQDNRVL